MASKRKTPSDHKVVQKQQTTVQPASLETVLSMHQPDGVAIIQRVRHDPKSLTFDDVLLLHQAVGNKMVDRLLAGANQYQSLQTKGADSANGKIAITERNIPPEIRRVPMPSGPTPSMTESQAGQQFEERSLPPVQSGSMTRSNFDQMMQRHFGVNRVFNGTQSDQQNILRSASGDPNLLFNPANWQDWNPGADSPLYAQIINGFRNFVEAFGGIPSVNEIGFFDVRYEYFHASRQVVSQQNAAAAFGGESLFIYRISQSGILPISKIIAHELGHGVVEIGLTPPRTGNTGRRAPDPQLINDYRRAVGWTPDPNPRLFDIGVPAVRQAVEDGRVPSNTYEITQNNWNDPRWIEKPISAYMTTHPSEDFPEAIMAYVVQPDQLRLRSPRRYQFIIERALQLGPLLRQIGPTPPQQGDFPVKDGTQGYG